MPKIANRWDVPDAEDARQKAVALKRRILEENFRGDIEEKVRARMRDPEAQRGVNSFAEETINFLGSVTNAIAVAYDYGCRRYLTGASEATAAAFSALVRETKVAKMQANFNVFGWLLGPTFVVPALIDGKMVLETVTPDVSWAKPQQDRVDAILWRAGKGYVEVDSDGWRYFDAKGQLQARPEFGAPAGVVPMKLTVPPIATFRTKLPGTDWWNSTQHRGLVAGTIEASFWWAHLGWIRKSQSGKLLVVKAPKDKLIQGQTTADAEMPFYFDGEPDEAGVELIDRIVTPEQHLLMIRFVGEQCAERYGIPGSEVTFDQGNGDWGSVSLKLRTEKLAHVHQQQVPFLTDGERQLWPAVVDVARTMGHPLAAKLPPRDEVEQMLAIEFPSPEVVTDPKARLELDVQELKIGLTSPTEIMQRRHPHLTATECKARQRENLSDYAELLDFIASRNMPGTPGAATQTLAEVQGAAGGTISGQQRREEASNGQD